MGASEKHDAAWHGTETRRPLPSGLITDMSQPSDVDLGSAWLADEMPMSRSALGPHDTTRLVDALAPLRRAFGTPYLVGSALSRRDPRDIDVRLMLSDDDPLLADSTRVTALALAVSVYLRHVTDLPIDFQFQGATEGNTHHGPRSALIDPQEATR